jgi:hypothetical protein
VADRLEPWIGRRLATAALCAVALIPLAGIARLHPYQVTYYNALVGEVEGASGRYDTDYWLSGYREAVRWIEEAPRPSSGGPAGSDGIEVLMAGFPLPGPSDLMEGSECWTERRPPAAQILVTDFLKAPATHAAAPGIRIWALPELWDAGRPADQMDYYVATTRWGYDRCFPEAEIAYRVERAGATFVVVKRLPGSASATAR